MVAAADHIWLPRPPLPCAKTRPRQSARAASVDLKFQS